MNTHNFFVDRYIIYLKIDGVALLIKDSSQCTSTNKKKIPIHQYSPDFGTNDAIMISP